MRQFYSASTLALLTFTSSVLSQDCPIGYGRSIDWIKCPTKDNPDLQCGTLDVPLDYSAPSTGGTLRIPLVRQPARDDLAEVLNKTIIYNPGGPGESGIDGLAVGTGMSIQDTVGYGYHVVSFDPRGVGLSKPFDNGVNNYNCPNVEDAPGGPLITDEDIENAFDGNTRQGNLCASSNYNSKGQLVGTAYVARDIIAITNALNEDGLVRYMGYSYGTLLGATLSAMFPQRLDRVVLDGNINPTDYYFGLGAESVADIDKGVAKFFVECVAAGKSLCPLAVSGESAKQLQDRFDRYLSSLYATNTSAWFEAKSDMFNTLRAPEGWPDYATKLSNSYTQAKITKREASAPFDPLTAKAAAKAQPNLLSAVTCGDWQLPRTASIQDFKDWLALYKKTSTYGGDTALITILYQCSRWPVIAKERFAGPYTGVSTRKPILFVQTMYDPVTPLVSAQNSSAGFLGSGVLLSSGTGHCSSVHPSTPLNKAISQYFASGVIPDTSKVFEPDVPAFQVKNPPKIGDAQSSPKKRGFTYPFELMTANLEVRYVLRRQVQDLPVGCIRVDSTSTSSSTTASSATSTSTTTTGGTTSTGSTATTNTDGTTSGTITSSTTLSSSSTLAANVISTSSSSTSISSTADSTTSTATSSSATTSGVTTLITSSTITTLGAVIVTSGSTTKSRTATTILGTTSSINSVFSINNSGSTSTSAPITTISGFIISVSGSPGSISSDITISTVSGTTSSTFPSSVSGPTTATNSDLTTWSIPSTWTGGSSFTTPSSRITSLTTFTAPPSLITSPAPNGPSTITTSRPIWDTSSVSTSTWTSTWFMSTNTRPYGFGNNPTDVGSQWLQWPASTKTMTSVINNPSWSQWTSKTTTSKTTTTAKDPSWDPWSSQTTGAITSVVTRFSTRVQTITGCPQYVKDCPYGSVVTKTIPYTTRFTIPTTTVIVTSIIDICPTGLTMKAITVTATCNAGCTKKPTGVLKGYTTTTVWCSACATPSFVVVTSPSSDIGSNSVGSSNNVPNSSGLNTGGSGNGGANNNGFNNGGSNNGGSDNNGGSGTGGSNGNSGSSDSGSNVDGPSNNAAWSTGTAAKPDATQMSKPSVGGSSGSASSSDGGSTNNGKPLSPIQSGSSGNNPSSSWSPWTGGDPTGSGPVAKYTGGAEGKTVHFGYLTLALLIGFFVV